MTRALALAALAAIACRSSLPGATLSGRVVLIGESDAHGIAVTASGVETVTTTTDADGHYAFGELPLGAYTVSATVRSTVEGTRTATVVANGALELPELRFQPAGGMVGRATRGGAQVGNAGILITVEGTSATGITDDAGNYHLELVPAGTRDLHAQAEGFRAGGAPAQLVRWGETTRVPQIDLLIGAGHGALRGTALLFGAGDHAGTQVVVEGTGLTATTASDGSWAIDGVPEGTFALHFTHGPYDERVPRVEALAGSDGFVIDESLYALPRSPLTLYAARRIAHTGATNDGPVVSPDGARLLYSETYAYPYTLQSVALDGSGAVTLADPWYGSVGDVYGGSAAFSPDGARVAFVRGAYLDIIGAAGGTAVRLVRGAGSFWFSPDGGALAYLAADPDTGARQLNVIGADGTSQRALVTDAKMNAPRWSADGARLIYRTEIDNYFMLGTVKLALAAGGAPTVVATGAWEPLFRADRRWALIAANVNQYDASSDLVSLDLGSGAVRTLASGVGHYDPATFGGDRAVYKQGKTLYSVPLVGGAATPLADAYRFTVSPDGARVAFETDCVMYNSPCKLWTVPVAGGTPQLIDPAAFTFAFSDDGNTLLYSTEQTPQGVAKLWVAPAGQPPRLVDDSTYPWAAKLTHDGSHIVYAKDVTTDSHGTLCIAPVAPGGTITVLGKQVLYYSASFSSDGKRLAFESQTTGGLKTLWVAPTDGSAAAPVIDGLLKSVFSAKGALVALRIGTPAPYRFQDGYYVDP